MSKVVLFAAPKVVPETPLFPWDPLSCALADLNTDILEQAAIVAVVFDMPELARMNADDAIKRLVELVKRPNICAVLDAYRRRGAH